MDGSYQVTRVRIDGELVEPVPGADPTLEVDGDRVSGHGGCNRFMGSINPDGTIGPLATTMMACPEPQMEFERVFHGLLSRVNDHRLTDAGLVLLEGELPLVELTLVPEHGEPKKPN